MLIYKKTIIMFFAGLMLHLQSSGSAQVQSGRLPRFEDYPVTNIYKGKPAKPIISTPQARMFRTVVREGVDKGWGVLTNGFAGSKGPNFAGKMIAIQWGCGSPCLQMAMVDAETGRIYFPPINWGGGLKTTDFELPVLTYPDDVSQNPKMSFRLHSSLFIIECNAGKGEHPFTYYFLWQKNRWIFLRRVPITQHP
jgi:hypothetical protein